MPHRDARVHGSTLVEVLVSVLILSIGLLGMARLQTAALVYTHDAWLQGEAVRLSAQLLDRMRANRAAALAGCYVHPGGGCHPGSLPAGSASRARRELAGWLDAVDQRLPSASARVRLAHDEVTVELRWQERGPHGEGSRRLHTGTRP